MGGVLVHQDVGGELEDEEHAEDLAENRIPAPGANGAARDPR